jgi:lipopolysaccharide export system permease protein
MRLIERYLFRQLMWPTLAASAALGGVALLSQTLSYLDVLIDQGQTLLVFAKIVVLNMPQLLAMVLPIAVFVAALIALNRMHIEQEIVVCFAAGFSRWRVLAPAIRLVTLVALFTLVTNLWIQPWGARRMREEMFAIKTDVAASLVRPGEFKHGDNGLTVYAQRADPGGVLKNLFVYREQPDGGSSTLSAREGRLGKRNGEPVLLLSQGANQEVSAKGELNYLLFDNYALILTPFLGPEQSVHYKVADRYLHELLFPDLTKSWEQMNRRRMAAEAHYRLSSPLYNFTFMLLAYWAVIGGPFTRLGYIRRVGRAAFAAALVRIVGFGVQAAADSSIWLNVLQYVVPIVPCVVALAALFRRRLPGVGRYAPRTGPDLVILAPAR